MTLSNTIQKYDEERQKRLRAEGPDQFTTIQNLSPELAADPFVNYSELNSKDLPFENGGEIGALIIGAGHCGLQFAVRLVESGALTADEMVLVDKAGGYGGTWWWNRYPGVMCDIESYVYVPLLEETGYMPKQKYSLGHEIREHAVRIAEHFKLRGLFATAVTSQTWNEESGRWDVELVQQRGPELSTRKLSVSARFVLFGGGIYTDPKVPKLPGLDQFIRNPANRAFHTARWDYTATGGTQEDPSLTALQDKRVAIIGTGATAIQAIPHLAKWAKHLYVIQRTPSYCAPRSNHPTSPATWSEIASGAGWQRRRQDNFDSFVQNDPQPVDLVADGWTRIPAFSGFSGHPGAIVAPDAPSIEHHVAALLKLDEPSAEALRARVGRVVRDAETAERLKAWYPGWCKRPTFHDEYLPTFNLPNVTLVDTDGRGVERLTEGTVIAGGREIAVDVLVLSTGFEVGSGEQGSPTTRGHMAITGRGGRSLEEKWAASDFGTLHGVATHGFPNLFFHVLAGGPSSPNLTSCYSAMGKHIAEIITAAKRKATGSEKVIIEARKGAEDEWMVETARRATWFSALAVCTPGFFNKYGRMAEKPASPEKALQRAKNAAWGEGTGHWQMMMEEYRAKDILQGVEVRV